MTKLTFLGGVKETPAMLSTVLISSRLTSPKENVGIKIWSRFYKLKKLKQNELNHLGPVILISLTVPDGIFSVVVVVN